MKMRSEFIKAAIFLLVGLSLGILIGAKAKPTAPQLPSVAQQQAQTCVATIKKHTNPDGSIDEVAEFLATHSQSQQVKPQDAEVKKIKLNGLGGFKDEILYKRKIYQDVKLFGLDFDVSALAKANKEKAELGVMIDF